MEFSDDLQFTHRDRKDIYEYVERYGRVGYDEARTALQMDPEAFGHHVAVLERDGVLERDDDEETITVAFETGEQERHTVEGIEYVIRQARQEDLTGLVGVMREALEEDAYIEGETVADMVDHENVLLRHNEVSSRVFFVATVGSEVVGWVHLEHPELDKLAHTAKLTVGVLDEYRGHGIGSRLTERGLDWAREQGFEKVYNSVPATNQAAIDFLEDHGMEVEAVREGHYKIDGEYVDEVMLAIDC